MKVKNYTTETVYANVANADSSFTFYIDVPHAVDEILLKSCAYYNNTTSGDKMIFIKSDLLPGKILADFPESTTMLEMLNKGFLLLPQRTVNGKFTFYLEKIDGSPYTRDGTIEVSMTFAFIEHEKA